MASEFNNLEDLIFSRSFRNWVLNKDSSERSFWENWVERHPDKAGMVKDARAVIYALHVGTSVLSDREIDEEIRKAMNRLKDAPRYIPLEGRDRQEGRRRMVRSLAWWVLILLLAGIAAGGWWYSRGHFRRDSLQLFVADHREGSIQEREADAIDERSVRLPDGSQVRLGRGSKLYFSTSGPPGRSVREIYLEGDAFVDVRKDPAVPFFVYMDQVIIKASGTGFVVRVLSPDGRLTVTDVTGNVTVFRRASEQGGILLTPNQAAVYDPAEDRIFKTLAGTPEPLGKQQDSLCIYRRTPVREVFGHLQDLYGIPIRFDAEALDSCQVTATLDHESFYEKLAVICKAIGGSYEVIDGNVVVTSAGCR